MHRVSSKAVDGGAATSVVGIRPHGRGRGKPVPVMSSRILLLSACLVGLAQPHGAQAPRVEMRVGFSDFSYMLHVGPPWLGQRWVGQSGVSVSSSLRLWSSGPVSVAGEVSANVRLPDRIPNACPDIPGAVCDFRDVGDVIRFGFSSRVRKLDGAGPYALAAAGWWGTPCPATCTPITVSSSNRRGTGSAAWHSIWAPGRRCRSATGAPASSFAPACWAASSGAGRCSWG
jgi:hypothetical protein